MRQWIIRIVVVSVVAAGVLGLSACGGEEPSGLPLYTPVPSSSSSAPASTSTSKWTAEQQQVLDAYARLNDLMTAILTKAEKIDMAKARKVVKEPLATVAMKGLDATLSAGYVQSGRTTDNISSVIVVGDTATIQTCIDESQTKVTNPGNPSAPRYEIRPPAKATVSLVRGGGSWLVSGFKGGEGSCVSG